MHSSGFQRKKICTIFIFVIFFNTSLVLLDFVFAYSCIELIGVEFAKIVYMENNSIWAIGIFTLARGLTAILFMDVKEESSEEMRIIITTYKNMFFVESIFLFILMLRCQVILVEMALGERKIQGIDKAIFFSGNTDYSDLGRISLYSICNKEKRNRPFKAP